MRTLSVMIMLTVLCGCFARGGVVGEQTLNLDAPLAAIHQAALNSLRADDIAVEEERHDQQSSLIKGRYADGVLVTIHGERLTGKASKLTIQVGPFGDKVRSQHLLDSITSRVDK